MTQLLNALTAQLLKTLMVFCSSKALSYTNKVLSTSASCHVPKDYRLLNCFRSFSKFLGSASVVEEKGHCWTRHKPKSSQEAGRL